jgi:hypothetical protein
MRLIDEQHLQRPEWGSEMKNWSSLAKASDEGAAPP